MGSSSREWADTISYMASRIYLAIIILQIPIFCFSCRIGVCRSPIEVTTCQLVASGVFPEAVVTTLLYPRAIVESIAEGGSVPNHKQLLKKYKSSMKNSPASSADLKHLEVLLGSYLSVAGAILGLVNRGRMSLFGLLLIVWGINRESIARKHRSVEAHRVYPEMAFVIFIGFLSVKRDVRKIMRSVKFKRIRKKMKDYLKSK